MARYPHKIVEKKTYYYYTSESESESESESVDYESETEPESDSEELDDPKPYYGPGYRVYFDSREDKKNFLENTGLNTR